VKIQVNVKPNSKTEEVSREGNSLVIKVKEPPKEGKANQAVIRLLARHFGVPQSHINITSGIRSKNKVIEVAD
jgi:uncharacterized protein (TIGR00251 family)